jgi:mannose-6-phosphate isomerase
MELYPLLPERHLDGRLWGGQRLARFLDLPQPHPERIAESWQVFDTNRILNGPLAGTTLAEAAQRSAERLVGTLSLPRYGADFPLLAKFIDARQDLSIQVHPDDAYAHRVEAHTGFHGKNEAWYILDAEPGADLFYHLARPVTRDQFEAAVKGDTLLPLLNRRPVAPGDVIFVPAGTLHTINAGILLFEIQQKSDLTYRVYDYGRPRPLHLEKALDVIAFDRPPPPPLRPLDLAPDGSRTLLVACRHFAMERWQLHQTIAGSTRPTSLEILTLTAGSGDLEWDDGALALKTGESVVLPASLGRYQLTPRRDLTLLRCYVPDLEPDVQGPLRQRGYSQAQIANVVRDAP